MSRWGVKKNWGRPSLENLEAKMKLKKTLGFREVRSPRKNFPRETELEIFSEMARIWENSCKGFSSKSLLDEGERSERLQAVPD